MTEGPFGEKDVEEDDDDDEAVAALTTPLVIISLILLTAPEKNTKLIMHYAIYK